MYKVLVKRRDIMTNEENNGLFGFIDTNFTFFNLNLQASKIKNGYLLKDSIHSLLSFVETTNLRASNP